MNINGMNISEIPDAALAARLRAIRRTLIVTVAALLLLAASCAAHHIVAIVTVGFAYYAACFTREHIITLFLQLLALLLLVSPLIPLLRERSAIRHELSNRYLSDTDK